MKKEFLVSGKQFFITEAMPLVSGDSNCYELVFYAPCDLSDSVFTVTATRSDGESFTGMGTVFGKTAKYVLDNSMYAVPGQLKLRTTITAPDETVITANEITFDVIEGTNSDGAVEADTNYPVLTQLILQVQDLIDLVPDAKEAIEKAERAAENAETEAIFANSAGVEARTYGAAAQVAAERAQGLLDKIDGVKDALPPAFSESDGGKILYLTKNGTVSDLVSESRSYSLDDNVISDAGLLDEERAFIDISGAEISDIGISDPLDDRCAFGFQLMPDSMNYTTDYDITVEEVEETDEGYRMIFPAEHCDPFAQNNIQSASDLFAIFERVQLNSDFPKDCLTPAWGTPGEVLPASFLDESIISPSVRLAKEYTDEKTRFTVTLRDSSYGPGNPFDLEGITQGVKRFELTARCDFENNPGEFLLYYIPSDGTLEQLKGRYSLPTTMKAGDRIVFDVEAKTAEIYTSDAPDVPAKLTDADDFLYALENEFFNRIDMVDLHVMAHNAEVEYYVSAEYMVDDKIKSAIIDSWEAAI